MNKSLIAALLAGATLSASADLTTVSFADKVTHPTAKVSKTAQSRKFKRLPDVKTGAIKVKQSAAGRAATPEGYVLFEGFEDWDGENQTWTPEGWTVDMKGEVEREFSWTPVTPNPSLLPSAPEGQYYYGITANYEQQQDEWLISPSVEIEDGMIASFHVFFNPVFLFMIDNDHVDFEKMEFIAEREVAATLQLMARAEGEDEWVKVFDIVDEYTDMPLIDLYYEQMTTLQRRQADLSAFAGKKINLALRYIGKDGDSMFVDAFGVGYPRLENISYLEPYSTLYWGFDRSAMLSAAGAPIAQHPVFADLTWQNYSDDIATFQWKYDDPEHKADFLTSDDQEILTVNYKPNYSTATTKKNNFHNPHVLTASAPKAEPGEYSAPYLCIQAGGKAEITFNDGTEFDGCLLPFAFQNQGITWQVCEDTEAGVLAIPVFGYDEFGNTDDYWLKYSLNGQAEKTETDYSHLTGFGNVFMPTEAPLVVSGLTLYAWGLIDTDAEITAKIYAFDADMNKDMNTMTEIATATCKGSDIIGEYSDANGYMTLPFDFSEPVVVKATDDHPAYIFFIEGFRSDKVKFFAPLQSAKPDVYNWGYIRHEIDMSAHTGRPAYTNLKPMVYKEDINDPESYVDPMGAFAIGINGEYPWLTCETESIEITDEAPEAKVALGSYYDGSKLTVDAPEGLIATVGGRYDECVLTVSRKPGTPAITDGVITVSGPGVKVSIKANTEEAGIHEITSAANGAEKIFDLQGRRVVNATKGNIYIVNGSKTIL